MLLRALVVDGFGLRQRQHDHLNRLFNVIDGVSITVSQQRLRCFERFVGQP